MTRGLGDHWYHSGLAHLEGSVHPAFGQGVDLKGIDHGGYLYGTRFKATCEPAAMTEGRNSSIVGTSKTCSSIRFLVDLVAFYDVRMAVCS